MIITIIKLTARP